MDQAEIEAALAEVCAQLDAAHGRLVGLVAAALTSRCWEGAGILSCEQWVAWHTGCSPQRARELVAVARRTADLPETVSALRSGELSMDQVAVVATHTPAVYDGAVAAFARSATVSQLRRTLRHHHFGDDPPEEHGRVSTDLTQGFDGDGRYRLRAVLDADEGAIVRQALQEAHDALFRSSEGRVSATDALVEVARRSLGSVTPLSRREAFMAVFHVPIGSSDGHLHGGPALPDRLRRQLLCDGRGMVVGVRHGRPVSLGRSTRIVPTKLRLLIEERDRGCRVPGCTATRVQIHHIRHWEDGGTTAPSNLVALCRRHHRLHHSGGLRIYGDPERPDGLVFVDRFGCRVGERVRGVPAPSTAAGLLAGAADRPAEGRAHAASAVTGTYRHPTGERLHTKWVDFAARPSTPVLIQRE
jgi:Domain of unknown function (DUF222)/HNH endonuclease